MKEPRYVGMSRLYRGLTEFLLSACTAFFAVLAAPPNFSQSYHWFFADFQKASRSRGKAS